MRGASGRSLSLFVVAGALLLVPMAAGAQGLRNSTRPPLPSPEPTKIRVEQVALPRGTHFMTGVPGALAASVDSDRVVDLWMHSTARSIQMVFSPVAADGAGAGDGTTTVGAAGSAGTVGGATSGTRTGTTGTAIALHHLTISGLTPGGIYYLYADDLQNVEVVTADDDGNYGLDFDLSTPRLLMLQANPSTFHIHADGTGCTLIGTFNAATLTCTLNRDVRQSIEIEDDGITLDGAGYTLDGTGPLFGSSGVFVRQRKNVTVKNLVIDRADTGVTVSGTSDSTFENITIQNGSGGFMELFETPGADTGRNIFRNNNVSVVCPPDTPCGFGVQGFFNNESTVTGNHFTDTKFGVTSTFSVKMDIEGNTFSDCPTGISVTSSLSPVTVTDNDISGSSVGIVVSAAIGCSIIGNVVDGSTEVGLHLPSLSCDVTDNTFSNGTLGLDLDGSQMTLFHNRFVNNTTQAKLGPNANNNQFIGAAPLGGNFWSDFDEVGEGCLDDNADGFCDDPYVLNLGADPQPWAADSGWLDGIPPTTSASFVATLGDGGWYRSDVTVNFTAADNAGGTGVLRTEFNLGGGSFNPAGSPLSVSGDGTATLGLRSIDRAGNVETTQSTTLKIDSTAPSIVGAVTPTPNLAGWNKEDVSVSFTCSDATSGIVSCPDAVPVSGETASTFINRDVFDNAGNSTGASVEVKLDKTAPNIHGAATSSPNAAGWYKAGIGIDWSCSDTLSGVASCPTSQTLSSEGADQQVSGTAFDVAGNSNSASVTGLNIDTTAPSISGTLAPLPNAAGWNRSSVTVSFSCSDDLSGIASCSSPEQVTAEGSGQQVTGTAIDLAGNSAQASKTVNLDETSPTITVQLSPAANAAGWNNGAVTASYTCGDALSGLASCSASQLFSGEGAGQTASGTATDVAGNSNTASASLSIDLTAPSVGFSGGCGTTAFLNQPFSTTVLAADGLSGIASQSIPNGSHTLASAPVGPHTETLSATDLAGNPASTNCNYTVVYDFLGGGGFNAPVDMPPVLNIAKAGSTIPVKWKLPDGLGGFISDLAVVDSIQAQEVSCSAFDDTLSDPIDTTYAGASGLHFDPGASQFIYNWKTQASMAGKCFLLLLNLNDGQSHEAHIKFRN